MKAVISKPLTRRPAIPPVILHLAVALFVGLLLSSLLQHAKQTLITMGVAGLAFFVAFLARPDVGVLLTLFARSSTDLAIPYTSSAGTFMLFASPNTSLILILILAGGVYIMSRKVSWLGLPGGTLLALMLLTGLLAMVRSEKLLFSFREWLPVVAAFVVYALCAHFFRSPEQTRRVIDVIALSFIIPAAYGFWQMAGHNTFILMGGLSRIPGSFVHPNPFGFYLVIIITLFTTQVLTTAGPRRLLSLGIVVAALVLLIETKTRIAWVGAVIALLTVGAYRSRALLVLLPLLVAFVAVVSPSSVARFGNPVGDTEASGVADRLGMWKTTYGLWEDATYVQTSSVATVMNRLGGLGPGAVTFLTSRVIGWEFSAHNDYIRVLNEYGIFGLALYCLLMLVMLRFAYRTIRAAARTELAAVPLTFFAVTLAFIAMSVTDNVFGATQNQVYYWALAGMTAAISQTLLSKPAPDATARAGWAAVRAPSRPVPKAARA